MNNNNLSVVIMHMLQERAEQRRIELENQIQTISQMCEEMKGSLLKRDMMNHTNILRSRVYGAELLCHLFELYSQEEWNKLFAEMERLIDENHIAYEEICNICSINGNCGWMAEMWQ